MQINFARCDTEIRDDFTGTAVKSNASSNALNSTGTLTVPSTALVWSTFQLRATASPKRLSKRDHCAGGTATRSSTLPSLLATREITCVFA